MKTALFAIVSIFALLVSSVKAEPPTGLVAWIEALKQLQRVIDDTMRVADVVTSNKLEEVNTRLVALISKFDGLKDGVEGTSKSVISKAAREAHNLIREVNLIVKNTRKSVFEELNKSLAVVSMLLDAIPIIDVDPYIAVVLPSRIETDFVKQNAPIEVFGFFPGEVGKAVTVSVDDMPVKVTRNKNNGLAIALPQNLSLRESSFLPIRITVTTPRWWGLSSSTTTIDDNIYVQKKEPFSCVIALYTQNPAGLKKVTATNAFTVQASTQGGEHSPTVNRVIDVEQLLLGTVPKAADLYDVKSAIITDPGFTLSRYGECEHKGPSGSLMRWPPKVGQDGSLSQSLKNDPHVQETTSA